MLELLGFISSLITLYIYIIIAGAVMSWLMAFNVVNPYNPFVRSVWQALNAVTEPLLRPIRRWMPDLGGIDISPVVLILACVFVQIGRASQHCQARRVRPAGAALARDPGGVQAPRARQPRSAREGIDGMVETGARARR